MGSYQILSKNNGIKVNPYSEEFEEQINNNNNEVEEQIKFDYGQLVDVSQLFTETWFNKRYV